jgi:hypothetical protein
MVWYDHEDSPMAALFVTNGAAGAEKEERMVVVGAYTL